MKFLAVLSLVVVSSRSGFLGLDSSTQTQKIISGIKLGLFENLN